MPRNGEGPQGTGAIATQQEIPPSVPRPEQAEGVIVAVGHGRSARRARHGGHVWWWMGAEHAAVAA